MKITGCVPLPGQGVVARFGDLVAVTEGTGPGDDPLLSALEAVASDAGDGAALVLAAARAVLANPGQPSGACAGVTSGGEVAVLVHGDAVVAVTVDGAADVELTASGSMLPVNRTFSGTTVGLRLAVSSRADFDPRLRLDGGMTHGSGLVVTVAADLSASAVATPRGAPAVAQALPDSRATSSAVSPAAPAATGAPATPQAAPVAGVAGGRQAGAAQAADEALMQQAESSTERLSPGWPPQPPVPDWPPQPPTPGWQPEPQPPGWQPEPNPPGWQPEPPNAGWQAEPPPPPVPPGPVPPGPVPPGPGGTQLSGYFAGQFPEGTIQEGQASGQAPRQAPGQAPAPDEVWITPDDEAEGWRAPAFVVPSQGQQPPGREPRLHQPDPTSDFESFLLVPQPGAPDEHDHPHPHPAEEALPPMPQEEADLYVPEPMLVDGVFCSRKHFNDPNVQYCRQCGIAMVQITRQIRKGQRPPLGVLLLDDGTGFTLDRDYVVGREPVLDGDVAAGRARPLRISDPDGTVSRLHLRISLVGWKVEIRDLGSANGSVLYLPSGEERLSPYDSTVIEPGARIGIGHRSIQYLSYRAG